jgi:hypothetical protein
MASNAAKTLAVNGNRAYLWNSFHQSIIKFELSGNRTGTYYRYRYYLCSILTLLSFHRRSPTPPPLRSKPNPPPPPLPLFKPPPPPRLQSSRRSPLSRDRERRRSRERERLDEPRERDLVLLRLSPDRDRLRSLDRFLSLHIIYI